MKLIKTIKSQGREVKIRLAFLLVIFVGIVLFWKYIPLIQPSKVSGDILTSAEPSLKASLKPLSVTVKNEDIYTSSVLGISFIYPKNKILVFEKENKICVTYNANDQNCEMGQFVEVFEKSADETIQEAIQKQFLKEKDLSKCKVTLPVKINYPVNFVEAEITFDINGDMEQVWEMTKYCSQNYAMTNGMRYFLMDKNHPTKLMFFSIGQYVISNESGIPWQETVFVL